MSQELLGCPRKSQDVLGGHRSSQNENCDAYYDEDYDEDSWDFLGPPGMSDLLGIPRMSYEVLGGLKMAGDVQGCPKMS